MGNINTAPIGCVVEVKTKDCFVLQIEFSATVKKRQKGDESGFRKTKWIRRSIFHTVKHHASECYYKEMLEDVKSGMICKEIESECANKYPLKNLRVKKVKLLSAPTVCRYRGEKPRRSPSRGTKGVKGERNARSLTPIPCA